ncbi:hypothetical protein EMIT0P100_10381 [Pseudomonas sp. IT-P100]
MKNLNTLDKHVGGFLPPLPAPHPIIYLVKIAHLIFYGPSSFLDRPWRTTRESETYRNRIVSADYSSKHRFRRRRV